MPVYRTMREVFSGQHLTDQLLRALARSGPGALIIANPKAGEFRLTHARWLATTNRESVVYGYGDLLHDLDWVDLLPQDRAWEALVAVADRTAHACLDREPWEPAHPRRRPGLDRLRRDMHRHGFALLRRPLYSDTGEVRRLDDTYLDTAFPHVTVTVATPYPDTDDEGAETFTWLTRHGCYTSGWHTPARELPTLAARIRARITDHT